MFRTKTVVLDIGIAYDVGISKAKVFVPRLLSRIEEANQISVVWIEARKIWTLAEIAAVAS